MTFLQLKRRSQSETVKDSVATLSGVGPKRVETLKTLHIETINDLLTHYPFRYDDIQEKVRRN